VIYNKHFTILPEKRKKKKERKSIKETLEKTEGAIKNGQSRENRRGNQEWTIQRKPKGQSRMDNPKKLARLGTQDTRRRQTKQKPTQHDMCFTISKQTQIT
jgi:hypothetical protein